MLVVLGLQWEVIDINHSATYAPSFIKVKYDHYF